MYIPKCKIPTYIHHTCIHYIHFITLPYIGVHYPTLRCDTSHSIPLHCNTVHYANTTLHYMHAFTFHSIPFHDNYNYNYKTYLRSLAKNRHVSRATVFFDSKWTLDPFRRHSRHSEIRVSRNSGQNEIPTCGKRYDKFTHDTSVFLLQMDPG